MKKYLLLAASLHFLIFCFGQRTSSSTIKNVDMDTVHEKSASYRMLHSLHDGDGYILVQLKRNKRSIDAYRKAGRTELANKLENDQHARNEELAQGFYNSFKFCRFYIIYADETDLWFQGKHNIALTAKLERDTLLLPPGDSNYVFCQYGSAQSYSDYTKGSFDPTPSQKVVEVNSQKIDMDSIPVVKGTESYTNSSLVLYDKNMQQMQRPFPYAMEQYFRNFGSAVRKLNDALYQAYYRQVVDHDMKLKRKAERKKQRKLMKDQYSGFN